MAIVTLDLVEARAGDVPPVCVWCGRPTGAFRSVRLPPVPWWVFLFPLYLPVILALFLPRRRLTVRLPLCARHWHSLHWPYWLAWALLGVSLALFFLSIDMLTRPGTEKYGAPLLVLIMLTNYIGLPLSMSVMLLIVRLTGVRLARRDADTVTLTGVAPEFVEAVRLARAEDRDPSEPPPSSTAIKER